jgi:uncharacterized protein YlxW (UPF0749 family)
VTLTIEDTAPGVAPETMLDVINELRAAGAEAMEIQGSQGDPKISVRVGVDTWVVGAPGALVIDGQTLNPPYTVVAIGDPPTLAAAWTFRRRDGQRRRVGGTMVQQSDRVDVTACGNESLNSSARE